MQRDDVPALVSSWLAVQSNWWAFEALREQITHQPEEAWRTLLQLVQVAESKQLLEDIGAGPLEDFLRLHASAFLERLEAEVSQGREARGCIEQRLVAS